MKKTIPLVLITLLLLTFNNTIAQTNLYENPKFDAIAKEHKIIGILPFNATVKLRPKQMKEMSEDQIHDLEESEGLNIQTAMYSWFLKRKKRGSLKVNVQDPKKTNALLNKKEITIKDLKNYTPEELAKILEVDAVIGGEFQTDKPMSDGASVALGLLVGFWGTTNSAVLNMSINNASDGELLWNYNKKVRGSLGSGTDDLINILMRKASRRLAYTK